jgi:hypothetical protein
LKIRIRNIGTEKNGVVEREQSTIILHIYIGVLLSTLAASGFPNLQYLSVPLFFANFYRLEAAAPAAVGVLQRAGRGLRRA